MTYRKQSVPASSSSTSSSSSSSSSALATSKCDLMMTRYHRESSEVPKKISGSTSSSPSSSLSLVMAGSFAALVLVLVIGVGVADAKPMGEIFPVYPVRSSAIKALKNLDNYASQHVRPRFGKRFGSGVTEEGEPMPPLAEASLIGADRWVLINRARPLTKLTETYLREILSENDRLNSGGEPSSESGLLGLGAA